MIKNWIIKDEWETDDTVAPEEIEEVEEVEGVEPVEDDDEAVTTEEEE